MLTLVPVPWGRCRIRVIDTFGTEPAYNHEEYATLHGYRTNWGYWNLNPKQFMTMFRECPSCRVGGAGQGGSRAGLPRWPAEKAPAGTRPAPAGPGLGPPGLKGSVAFQKERPQVDWVVEGQGQQAFLSGGNRCSGMGVESSGRFWKCKCSSIGHDGTGEAWPLCAETVRCRAQAPNAIGAEFSSF